MKQLTNPAQASWPVVVNENFDALAGSRFAYDYSTTTGLTLGYFGGHVEGTPVAGATIALDASNTVYVVIHRTTGVVSKATTTTDWLDVGTYGRLFKATTSGSAITNAGDDGFDWRDQPGGIFDQGGAAVGALTAADIPVVDAGTYFTGTDVEAALQEIGAALAASVSNVPAQRYTIELLDTTDSDPGAGLVKFNHATPTSATFLYIDDSTSDSVDLSTYFASLGATGFVKIQSTADAGEWAVFKWSAVTDGTGYWKFAVVLQASNGTLDDADAVLIEFDSDASGSAGMATDALWDAAGDLAVGSGANTAAKLPIGTARQKLRVNSGATAPEWVADLQCLAIACSDETTALTTGTGKAWFVNPYPTAFNIAHVVASLTTPQASGSIFTVDINKGSSPTSILSTKLTIDNTEYTGGSEAGAGSATVAVISDASIAAYGLISVDIDQIGNGTAKGLKVYLLGTPST